MPIYEYRCKACDTVFEEWAKSFDSPEHEPCPKCGGDAVRIVSNTTFVLKGGGWYVTEYGNHKTDHESGAGAPDGGKPAEAKEQKADAPSKEAAPAATESASASASDSKPDTGKTKTTAAA